MAARSPQPGAGGIAFRAETQACFDDCVSQGAGDIHKIDGNDQDGLARERLP